MNQLKHIYILILLFIFSIAGLRSSGSGPEARASRIIEKFMKTHKMPGLSITVGKEGEIIWSEGF
ncbi:MAG: serine hydrolase, partial [Candidatus Marinimicrobia bacterium]|nr:serine hydrolase [Candidatus Neomarinimicrobiota bacterium]